MALTTPTTEALQFNSGSVFDDVTKAAYQAHETILAECRDRGIVHKLPVCYKASELIVESLISWGYDAAQEFVVVDEVGPHSYIVMVDEDEELIVDSTWQQLLPKNGTEDRKDLPRVLVGNRHDVMQTARSCGVSESVLRVWEAQPSGMSIEQHRLNDQEAEAEAKAAHAQGAWDKFMAS